MDRMSDSGSEGCGFESRRGHKTVWSVSFEQGREIYAPNCFVPHTQPHTELTEKSISIQVIILNPELLFCNSRLNALC